MPRLFVAIELPEAVKHQLEVLRAGIAGVRWLQPEQLHLTLKFIGDTDNDKRDAIHRTLSTIRAVTFSTQVRGVGQFPARGTAKVLWAGMDAPEQLINLQKLIEAGFQQIGIPRENRPFAPHITLTRLKKPISEHAIQTYITQHEGFKTKPFQVEQFVLYSSTLTPQGSVYEREAVYLLSQDLRLL